VSSRTITHAARHESDSSSNGTNRKTAAMQPVTSTSSKAMQVAASNPACPNAPPAMARRRAPRCSGGLPSSRFTGSNSARSGLKRRQPR